MRNPVLLIFFLIPLLSHGLCVTTDSADLRTGPGEQFDKSWKVFKYMPFEMVTKRGNWIQVKDFEGEMHWIQSKAVSKDKDCAVVKVFRASLRKGPGTKYIRDPDIPEVNRYTAFKVIKRNGLWVKVLGQNNKSYWVSGSLLWQNKK